MYPGSPGKSTLVLSDWTVLIIKETPEFDLLGNRGDNVSNE